MNAPFSQKGFSLLEVMVTMFVVALMVTMVGINIGNFDIESQLQDYGEDLQEQLRFGSDEALFSGEHLGLVPQEIQGASQSRWQLAWHRWRDGAWQPVEDLPAIEPPEFVELAIEIDDEPVDLWQWLDFEEPLPVIIFYGGGEALAGTIILSLTAEAGSRVQEFERRHVHMEINEIGRLRWRERAEQDELAAGGF
jgi:prepilin-type N-terminal cleavage/methylation domain-containing protein